MTKQTRPDGEEKKNERSGRLPVEDKHGPGAQGPNVGYWQAVGSTRSAAKRSKRP